jgi:hypothetical protein
LGLSGYHIVTRTKFCSKKNRLPGKRFFKGSHRTESEFYNMAKSYNDNRTLSPYLSTDPDDAGMRYRVSGDLLLVYGTARAIDSPCRRARERSQIVRFSKGAASRMGRYLRESDAKYGYMHTLTYPSEYPSDGRLVKYQLRRYLQELTRLSHINGHKDTCSFFWFIEFQKRGAPHFHIFTTEFIDFKFCANLWFDIVASGDPKHLKAGVRVEKLQKGRKGLICYAKKYAIKQSQKEVPELYSNVGRFWGIHGLKTRKAADVVFYTDSLRNRDIFNIKTELDELILCAIQREGLKLIKSDFNFRMFHVEQCDGVASLLLETIRRLSNELHVMQEAMFDCEISSGYDNFYRYDYFTGDVYRGGELYRAIKQGNVVWQ